MNKNASDNTATEAAEKCFEIFEKISRWRIVLLHLSLTHCEAGFKNVAIFENSFSKSFYYSTVESKNTSGRCW